MAKTNLLFFSVNHCFNADQSAGLDHHTASQMPAQALGNDGTEV